MEEKFKRGDRRHRTRTILKRRIKNYLFFDIHVRENHHTRKIKSNAEKMQHVLKGDGFQFLRTTSCPCNCYTCSEENKFRTHRAKEKREAWKIINNE